MLKGGCWSTVGPRNRRFWIYFNLNMARPVSVHIHLHQVLDGILLAREPAELRASHRDGYPVSAWGARSPGDLSVDRFRVRPRRLPLPLLTAYLTG